MAQQPNPEIGVAERPRSVPEPGPARPWTPDRPGDVDGAEQPTGGAFGHPGPDAGYALRILTESGIDLGGRPRAAAAVLTTIAGARASHFGRAPVIGDLRVAAALLGLGPGGSEARLDDILDHAAHEHTKGHSFLASIPRDVLAGDVDGAAAFARS
jgi:hypothetical protein